MAKCSHVWRFARFSVGVGFHCERCHALVEMATDRLVNGNTRMRFRSLGGTDRLVSDADFRELAAWLSRVLDSPPVYSGVPRSRRRRAA